jgi:anti-sigma regulatory factor (Ser/Thr protein kinase)
MPPVVAQETARLTTSELRLPAQPSALGAAREYVEEAAAAFGLDEEGRYDFAYAVNEAVTNAIRHGVPDDQGQICLVAVASGELLTLAVRDYGTFVLPVAESAVSSDHGRGLALMARLTDETRVSIEPGGTTVYLSKARA